MMKRHSVWPHVDYIQNMKRIYLSIILLLSALSKGAGQSVAHKSTDLAVTADIVGHSYKPADNDKSKSRLILYVRIDVRNQTNQPRDVIIMSCGWDDSWIQKGTYGFCGWGCDKNVPQNITIPIGQSLVFYAPVCQIRESEGGTRRFMFGFMDSMGCYYCIPSARKRSQYLNTHTVYWSNELDGNINPATTPEITGRDQYPGYSLTEAGK